ncbi:annexin B11-like [Daphnia pulicaria]|uniref:annexin B11-like n=1 Tax=Daphnia pulicaria TaxID=35523 RepID=UPI001EEBD9D4|nr:annexin B11-like [Daphnia pulicaria]
MGFLFIFFVLCFGTIFGQDLPTLVPAAPFDPNSDAARLFDAMNGLGTDENKIISVLCYRTASQRDVITTTYNNQHGSLAKDLQSELTGSFQTLSIMLTHGMIKFLSIELHETMARPGTDEPSLTEVIMSRSNQELDEIETFFNNYYGHSLVSEIEADTTGSYRQLLIQMAEGRRDETMLVNMTAVQIDVVDLYEGGPAIDGTDENLYINIFTLRNFVHLNKVSILYEATYGTSLNTVVTTEFTKDMGNALVSILQYSADKALYFSSRFHTTIAGAGTADRDLMRLTVSRCETDLGNIKIAYQNIYGVSLSTAVSDDTSGSYRTALLALID